MSSKKLIFVSCGQKGISRLITRSIASSRDLCGRIPIPVVISLPAKGMALFISCLSCFSTIRLTAKWTHVKSFSLFLRSWHSDVFGRRETVFLIPEQKPILYTPPASSGVLRGQNSFHQDKIEAPPRVP